MLNGHIGKVADRQEPGQGNERTNPLRLPTAAARYSMNEFCFLVRCCHS
jgi:hypothetical protein